MNTARYDDLSSILRELKDYLLQVAVYSGYDKIERAVLIFEDDPPAFFEALQPLVRAIRKRRLPEPLIVNRVFVESSLDSYPLEFLNMQTSYRNLLANNDILKGLSFAKADLRLQMERELKSKWLLTRQAVLENPYKLALVREAILRSRTAVYPVLKGFFALVDEPVPKTLNEAIEGAERISGCELAPFAYSITGSPDATRYINMLGQLVTRVQEWKP